MISRQSARYAIVGCINTAVGLSSIFIAMAVFGFREKTANALGYSVGLVLSYALNRLWTFEHTGKLSRSIWRFLVLVGVAYCINLFVVHITSGKFSINPYMAQIIGVFVYSIIVFFGGKCFVFNGDYRKWSI